MDKISGLSDDLLVKILSFVPTKVAVSTTVMSKRWECLWMWVPTLEYDDFEDINTDIKDMYRVSVHKNLISHRAPIIESLRLKFCLGSLQPEDIKQWVSIAVSRCVRPDSALPSSLYTSKTLVTLKLEGNKILVDVPPTVCLPSLTTLQLSCVTYLDEASLRMLLSNCPVLEDLVIERDTADDNAKGLVVAVPSLQRLSLQIDGGCCSYDGICRNWKRQISLLILFNNEEESMYCSCIVFSQLKRLKLSICNDDWSKLLFRLLKDSPKLRVLNLHRASRYQRFDEYERSSWDNEWSVTPNCLLKTLETFEYSGCMGRPEERAFLSFFFNNARCLKSTSILR
ncbi:BnaA02g11000D [Brassica napus]|uniref:BnaA02g11000D protein n=1 Tax=Brassica napus TaxID=3708 RepID=A0A078GKL7_BRANA|nr:BnaA02g11000D [Brassica napus]